MKDMNSGPQDFDSTKGPVTPTRLDGKAEAAREGSSMRFHEVAHKSRPHDREERSFERRYS
jgi:hypothetical protein